MENKNDLYTLKFNLHLKKKKRDKNTQKYRCNQWYNATK